jgi:6-phosphogluconolactonase
VSGSIVVCELDEQKKSLRTLQKLQAGKRPGYLTIRGSRLYAVSTDIQGEKENTLRAFEFQQQGDGYDLKLLSEVSSKGMNPCHISVDHQGTGLYAANYTSGSIVQYQIKTDGSLGDNWYFQQFTGSGIDANRQQAPHAHYIHTTLDNMFALTADLGTDKVMVHRHDQNRKLKPNEAQLFFQLSPGSGPRHLEFHPNNQWVYVLNELNSTITTVRYQEGKFMVGKTVSTLPEDFKQESKAAAVRIHPSGKYIYSSNRGSDSISVFAIDEHGDLTRIQTFGDGLGWVRDFNITPSGNFILAGNEKQDQVALLGIGSNGRIEQHLASLSLPSPSCFVFLK